MPCMFRKGSIIKVNWIRKSDIETSIAAIMLQIKKRIRIAIELAEPY